MLDFPKMIAPFTLSGVVFRCTPSVHNSTPSQGPILFGVALKPKWRTNVMIGYLTNDVK